MIRSQNCNFIDVEHLCNLLFILIEGKICYFKRNTPKSIIEQAE